MKNGYLLSCVWYMYSIRCCCVGNAKQSHEQGGGGGGGRHERENFMPPYLELASFKNAQYYNYTVPVLCLRSLLSCVKYVFPLL